MVTVEAKICTRCTTEKPAEDFHKHKSGKGGLQAWCKSCCNERAREKSAEAREERERIKAERQARFEARPTLPKSVVGDAYERLAEVVPMELWEHYNLPLTVSAYLYGRWEVTRQELSEAGFDGIPQDVLVAFGAEIRKVFNDTDMKEPPTKFSAQYGRVKDYREIHRPLFDIAYGKLTYEFNREDLEKLKQDHQRKNDE